MEGDGIYSITVPASRRTADQRKQTGVTGELCSGQLLIHRTRLEVQEKTVSWVFNA
jgi:hypothetical protein